MANFVRSFLNEKVAKGDASGPHDLNAKQTRYLKAIHVHIIKKKREGKKLCEKNKLVLGIFYSLLIFGALSKLNESFI